MERIDKDTIEDLILNITYLEGPMWSLEEKGMFTSIF